MKIVVIGEVLWDLFPGEERLGGAPFNFAVQASRLGHDVRFVSAVGADARGSLILNRAEHLGLDTQFLHVVAGRQTGVVSVHVDAEGKPAFHLHRPAAYDSVTMDDTALDRLRAWDPDWMYFGTLHQMQPEVRELTARMADTLHRARKFYDINLRPHSYTLELVESLMAIADAVKWNDEEAREVDAMFNFHGRPLEEFTAHWQRQFGWQAVAVTRGPNGSSVRIGDEYAEGAGFAVTVADTVGAGDAFAAAFLHGLSQGWNAAKTGEFANRVGALVASRPGAIPEWSLEDCRKLAIATHE
ncbi:MAG: hypothetical protein JNK48_07615 [Bryobacterales bacterium]|nr:hypothetical protein [Bryobacterales bacterium]